jgi:hypothetical protein
MLVMLGAGVSGADDLGGALKNGSSFQEISAGGGVLGWAAGWAKGCGGAAGRDGCPADGGVLKN